MMRSRLHEGAGDGPESCNRVGSTDDVFVGHLENQVQGVLPDRNTTLSFEEPGKPEEITRLPHECDLIDLSSYSEGAWLVEDTRDVQDARQFTARSSFPKWERS